MNRPAGETKSRAFQAHTIDTARKYNVSTDGWDELPVRIIDGEYPLRGYYPVLTHQDFGYETRAGKTGGYEGFVGELPRFRDDLVFGERRRDHSA